MKAQVSLSEEFEKLSAKEIESDTAAVARAIAILEQFKDTDPAEGVRLGNKLLERIEGSDHDLPKLEFRNALAGVYFQLRDYDKAERLLRGSVSLAKKKGFVLAEAKTLTMLGNLYRVMGRYNESLVYLDEAQMKASKAGAYDQCAKIFSHKGFIYWQKGQNLDALKNFQRSADLNDSLHKEKAYASSIMGIALIYDDIKETDKAWDYYKKALLIYQKHNDFRNASTALLNLSEMLSEQSSLDSAFFNVNRCIEVAKKNNLNNTLALAYVVRGRILLKKGKVKESETDLFRASAIAKETEDMSAEANACLGLFDLYKTMNQAKKMEVNIVSAIDLFKTVSDSVKLKECYQLASAMFSNAHNYEKAYQYRILFDSLNMRSFNHDNRRVINEMLVKYDAKIKQAENEKLIKENQMSKTLMHQQEKQKYLIITVSFLVLLLIFFIIRGLRFQRDNFRLKVKEQEIQLIKLNEMKTDAELKALQARINPHFLYNSLNSIASLIATSPAAAEEMTVKLSKLFRYTINLRESNWSTVAEELNMVQIYLDVEKLRFGDRITFHVNCDPSAENYFIPRFIIQPLVENSLKHGLKDMSKDGVLKVEIFETGEHLKVIVGDNGIPFPKNLMAGYGLQSITDKLNLLCGESWRMDYRNEPEKRIEIVLPKKTTI